MTASGKGAMRSAPYNLLSDASENVGGTQPAGNPLLLVVTVNAALPVLLTVML